MSTPVEQIGNQAPPPPPGEAAPQTPAAPQTVKDEIAAANAEAQEFWDKNPNGADNPELSILSTDADIAAFHAGQQGDQQDGAEAKPEQKAAETPETADDAEKKAAETGTADAGASAGEAEQPAAIVFDPAKETAETYQEKKTAILAQYDLPDEIKSLIEYNETKASAAAAGMPEIEALGGIDTVLDTAKVYDQVYDTKLDDKGQPIFHVDALDNHLRTKHAAIYGPLANHIFRADSLTLPNASVFEEILVENFGKQKAAQVASFLKSDVPLPAVPPGVTLPEQLPANAKEAYFQLPEVRRFEINEKIENLKQLEKDLAETTDDYYKAELKDAIVKARSVVEAEAGELLKTQKGIDLDRAEQERVTRHQVAERERFAAELETEYQADIDGLEDTFVTILAPTLNYADADTQTSQARNALSRIVNAFRFDVTEKGYVDDPRALRTAQQLKAEGVNYDFDAGRDLFKQHFAAKALIKTLSVNPQTPKQSLDKATREYNAIMLKIKTEVHSLVGQLSKKYVDSGGKALEKKVEAAQGKKQIPRIVVNGKADGKRSGKDTPQTVKDEIAAYNRQVAQDRKNLTGDELFDSYQ